MTAKTKTGSQLVPTPACLRCGSMFFSGFAECGILDFVYPGSVVIYLTTIITHMHT